MQATSTDEFRSVRLSDRSQAMSDSTPSRPRKGSGASACAVWLVDAADSLASEVRARLKGLDIHVWLWDGAQLRDRNSIPLESDNVDPTAPRKGPSGCASVDRRRTACRGGLAPGALRRVKEHIEGSLGCKIEIATLAGLAQLSECHFSRAFGQSVGTPPHRYIVARRIAIARELIQLTNRPLIDIALELGFSDHSHFTRSFVRATGETPRACRQRHR